MKKVLIIYKFLPQYRVDFFNKLREELLKDNIELQLIYGKLKNSDSLKKDEVDIEWAKFIPNKTWRLGRIELIWQPCLKHLKGQHLIIVEQANKLLINYYLMIARHFHSYKFAYWGHGRNMQDNPNSIMNKFKYLFLTECDWWFAYTVGVKDFLETCHFNNNKITVVQNAIDTRSLRNFYASIDQHETELLKQELGISSSHVGIYCGGMYPEKRLDFIIEALKIIKSEVTDFHMIFVGSGVDSYKVEAAAKNYDWIHYVGPKFGNDRVRYFKISSIQLMPGLVGLGILDSFALETPIVTTDYQFHSPEIEYLTNSYNGMITKNSLSEYTKSIIELFKSKNYLQLIEGCKKSADIYTIEKMVDNFKSGIIKCLNINK